MSSILRKDQVIRLLSILLILLFVPAAPSLKSVQAATIFTIPCRDVASLITAINNANRIGEGIILLENCTYDLTAINNTGPDGSNGLPVITGAITIRAMEQAMLMRSNASEAFRIFSVGPTGKLILNNITLFNGLEERGGAIYSTGVVQLVHSTVANNTAVGSGGGLYIDVHPTGEGTLILRNSTVVSNLAYDYGGGIHNAAGHGSMQIFNSELSVNKARYGGAISIVPKTIIYPSSVSGSTFYQNYAEFGGGIYGEFTNIDILNSTFYQNYARQEGGGIALSEVDLQAVHLTIAENIATAGAGGIDATGGMGELSNSIVSFNVGANCRGDFVGSGNLEYGGASPTCGAGTTIGDPKFGVFQNNGGPTPTLPILPGSSAIGLGNETDCTAYDQRLFGRPAPLGTKCDAGAYEGYDLYPPEVQASLAASEVALGSPILLTLQITNPNPAGQPFTELIIDLGLPFDLSIHESQSLENTCGGQASDILDLENGQVNGGSSCTIQFSLHAAHAGSFTLGEIQVGTHESGAMIVSSPGSFLVTRALAAIKLTASENLVSLGQPVTLTAQMTTDALGVRLPYDQITFYEETTSGDLLYRGSAGLSNGLATLTLSGESAGRHIYRAEFSGNDNFEPAQSQPLNLVVRDLTFSFFPIIIRP